VSYARPGLHDVDVGTDHFSTEHRALRVRRVEHPRQLYIDAEEWRAGHDLRIVHAGHARTEQPEILRILERHGRRRRERRGLRRELTILGAAIRRTVND